MELSKIKSVPIPTEVEYNGETLGLTVSADVLTAEFLSEMEAAAEGEPGLSSTVRQINFMIGTITKSVTQWDLTDNGAMLPVSADVLRQLPQSFINALFGAVMGAGVPKQTTGGTSAGG